jgi:lipoate-protein ligase A
LVIDGDLPGAVNMARDVAILDHVCARHSAPTLRLYGWRPPCLSLGRHQGTDAADLAFCRHESIDVVRRPTGGRAVLHHLELTYAATARLGIDSLPRALQAAYRLMCSALVRACRSLGVAADLTAGEVNLHLPSPATTIPCFEAPAGGEVVVAGRKLVGSAMRAHGGAVLQHGAILLDWDGRLQAGAMGLDSDNELRPAVTTFRDQLGSTPQRQELEAALVRGFEQELDITLEPGELSEEELARAEEFEEGFRVG